MSGHCPVLGFGRSLTDQQRVVKEPRPAGIATTLRLAHSAPGAQAPCQLPAQLASALHVDRLVTASADTCILISSLNSRRSVSLICVGLHRNFNRDRMALISGGCISTLLCLGRRARCSAHLSA